MGTFSQDNLGSFPSNYTDVLEGQQAGVCSLLFGATPAPSQDRGKTELGLAPFLINYQGAYAGCHLITSCLPPVCQDHSSRT